MPLSIVVPATAHLREVALRLLFSPLPAGQREGQLAETLAAVDRRELSLDNLVVAVDGDQVLGTVLAVVRPGGAVFLWPPVVRAGIAAEQVSAAMLKSVADRVDAQGAMFTQCLLEPDDARGQATLERGGFPYATDLMLLSRSLTTDLPAAGPAAALAVECYSNESHARFARIIERSYDGTLDCPALARLRGGEDSLEAHRATGQFVPNAWRLYRSAGMEVGVLLLAEHRDRDLWEVAYLGVVPEARGRGMGRAILHDGLAMARDSGHSAIEIAADAGNAPALSLYRGLGFNEIRRFAVHLRVSGHAVTTRRTADDADTRG
jgi:ribosomal protein S18 acetylase RimI-like enzyme